MQRIVVLNPKGGSGKTTLATNLASYFACRGDKTVLMDYDSQGSSTFWVGQRAAQHPPVQVISAYKQPLGVTRSWFLRVPPQTQTLVIDTPAALDFGGYQRVLQEAASIVIPVLPADIDIHAAANCIADLLTTTKISREDGRIAVIANRARKNTLVYQRLAYFLNSLRIPFLTTLRDSQNYINAAAHGLGIFDMPEPQVQDDLTAWQPLLSWLNRRELIEQQLQRESGMARSAPALQQNRFKF
ncbi:MAG TPA: AAA family ATPase [Spongiibacteraceae bacterium]|nr:AAA family ATPase [Spongiibacteraceae bacterium]